MNMQIFSGAKVFDGTALHAGLAVRVQDGVIRDIVAASDLAPDPNVTLVRLNGGTLAPAFLDLQVNGGGGLMLDGSTDLAGLRHICATHLRLGAAGVLPTLITDSATATAHVIATAIAAARINVPGFLGLHLEGPHLDPARKGAHDPGLIRPMADGDLARLCDAARALPVLMLTVAPEAVTPAQIAKLVAAGAIVSLGHSDCSYADARAAIAAGAGCVTHLFNAMRQLGNREPGLVGAALDSRVAAGLIADGLHVAPAAIRIAVAAKPEGVFLISDCMAFAGTDLTEMQLGGRRILRQGGRLTLQDGTLAGADLTLAQAIRVMVQTVGLTPARVLAMATSVPADVIGVGAAHGRILQGRAANLVHLTDDWRLDCLWHDGTRLEI